MSPEDGARNLYETLFHDMSWERLVEAVKRFGVVVDTPELYALLRPVPRSCPAAFDLPMIAWKKRDVDCWYVQMAAGRLADLWGMDLRPELPWVAWHSRHHGKIRLHCHPFARLRRFHE